MDYRVLSEDQLRAVQQEKLLALEIAHARLTLDACLAEASGVPAEEIAPTRRDIAVVIAQADALVGLMSQPPALPRRTDA
jgi:hypothetical protein